MIRVSGSAGSPASCRALWRMQPRCACSEPNCSRCGLIWMGEAHKSPDVRSGISGFQYTLVDSIATCVHAACDCHSVSRSNSAVVVPNRCTRSSPAGPPTTGGTRPPILCERRSRNSGDESLPWHTSNGAGRRVPQCESLPGVLLIPQRVRATVWGA